MKPRQNAPDEPRHGIAVVSRRTGLSQLVLRAWERRYAAVRPARTDTGRRLYSDGDLARLTLLKTLTDAGHRIGDIAGLTLDDLHALAGELPPPAAPPPPPAGRSALAAALLQRALAAIADLDPGTLREILDEASLSLSKPLLRNELIVPLLAGIGERWRDGALRVAQEHMASAVVRDFLSAMNARHAPPSGAPVLIVATPSKQTHELGALLVASQALDAGWNVVYLGADLPAEEIAMAVRSRGARALFLSLIYPLADETVSRQLLALRELLGPDLPVLVAGRAAESYAETLDGIGARRLDRPQALDRSLTVILSS